MSEAMTVGTIAMPRPKSADTVKRVADNPRPLNGNMYAIGAYLEKLRTDAGLHREPLVRTILDDMRGNITMSMSTLSMIETGKVKSSGFTTIDAIRRAVGGDPYDISELSRLPIPEDDDLEAIEVCRNEGSSAGDSAP
jgi:DNA-binding Xre family transcriptional regulator